MRVHDRQGICTGLVKMRIGPQKVYSRKAGSQKHGEIVDVQAVLRCKTTAMEWCRCRDFGDDVIVV
eukprot:scaffold8200_cov277-Pinguiococcus_pyrenoidosus.AAC.1